ncbi:uncharacterized protein LOC133796698 [Humulus lupulus]|uniref:uncharacterized protein LOC133796698 n=1 Tax=Humulus lupulus TaxID=3486 RepID=UPI002B4111FA|nr:uncharacterized protein LOC133796698 [Humulus lupulus]
MDETGSADDGEASSSSYSTRRTAGLPFIVPDLNMESTEQEQPNMESSTEQEQPNMGSSTAQEQPNMESSTEQEQPNMGSSTAQEQPIMESSTEQEQHNMGSSTAQEQPNLESSTAQEQPNMESTAHDQPNMELTTLQLYPSSSSSSEPARKLPRKNPDRNMQLTVIKAPPPKDGRRRTPQGDLQFQLPLDAVSAFNHPNLSMESPGPSRLLSHNQPPMVPQQVSTICLLTEAIIGVVLRFLMQPNRLNVPLPLVMPPQVSANPPSDITIPDARGEDILAKLSSFSQKMEPTGVARTLSDHILEVGVGEDIIGKLRSFSSQMGVEPSNVFVPSAVGSVFNPTLKTPTGQETLHEGEFVIVKFNSKDDSSESFLVSLFRNFNGHTDVFDGEVSGKLIAAKPTYVQVMVRRRAY